jgi:hypothetical protein
MRGLTAWRQRGPQHRAGVGMSLDAGQNLGGIARWGVGGHLFGHPDKNRLGR